MVQRVSSVAPVRAAERALTLFCWQSSVSHHLAIGIDCVASQAA